MNNNGKIKILEEAVEELENCYGKETELTIRIRNILQNESDIELKKCPFCGGKAEYGCVQLDYPAHNAKVYVYCECGAELARTCNIKKCKKVLEKVIELWNERK